jgi:hypothetical protein
MPKINKFNLFFLGSFFFILLFHVFNLPSSPSQFISFTKLEWETSKICEDKIISILDKTSLVLEINGNDKCSSKSFFTDSNILKFNYLIKEEAQTIDKGYFSLEIFHKSKLIKTHDLIYDVRFDYPHWRTLYVELPEYLINKAIHLKVKGSGALIRNRLEFISKTPNPLMFSPNGNFKPSLPSIIPLSILLGMIIFLLFKYPEMNNKSYAGLLLLSIFLSFFSLKTFFYFDEWTVLNGFKNIGSQYITAFHNEHFLPIFFAWYYFLINLFKSSYLIIQFFNFIFHFLHSLLLLKVSLIFGFNKSLSRIFVLLYSISSLHLEVLEWAFVQSIILSSISTSSELAVSSKFKPSI